MKTDQEQKIRPSLCLGMTQTPWQEKANKQQKSGTGQKNKEIRGYFAIAWKNKNWPKSIYCVFSAFLLAFSYREAAWSSDFTAEKKNTSNQCQRAVPASLTPPVPAFTLKVLANKLNYVYVLEIPTVSC